jgi:hypothetical protein
MDFIELCMLIEKLRTNDSGGLGKRAQKALTKGEKQQMLLAKKQNEKKLSRKYLLDFMEQKELILGLGYWLRTEYLYHMNNFQLIHGLGGNPNHDGGELFLKELRTRESMSLKERNRRARATKIKAAGGGMNS